MERLKEIEERMNKATPGKWKRDAMLVRTDKDNPAKNNLLFHTYASSEPYLNNAEFIAHAPEDMRYLLDQLEADNKRAEEYERASDDRAATLLAIINSQTEDLARLSRELEHCTMRCYSEKKDEEAVNMAVAALEREQAEPKTVFEKMKAWDIVTMASFISSANHLTDYENDDYDPEIMDWLKSEPPKEEQK